MTVGFLEGAFGDILELLQLPRVGGTLGLPVLCLCLQKMLSAGVSLLVSVGLTLIRDLHPPLPCVTFPYPALWPKKAPLELVGFEGPWLSPHNFTQQCSIPCH